MSTELQNRSNDISLSEITIDLFLKKYFYYYNTLDAHWQNIFCERVIYFATTKNFKGFNGFVPNNQVKAIVSASAVQLTLGLEVWDLHYFNTILLFPDDFFNEKTGLKLKGETNLGGFISLSWKSFLYSYKIRDDNLNLGLHEFTHALRFNGLRDDNTDYFFSHYFEKWYCIGRKEFSNLSNDRPSIFRKYGGANVNEFLSVVVEHFFESPKQFKNEQPLLFSATAILLNQKQHESTTQLDVRAAELNSQNSVTELPEMDANVSFFKTTSAYVGMLIFCLAVFTLIQTGFNSFPTLFLFGAGFLNMAISDFKYTRGSIQKDKISLSKGFLVFKNRKKFSIAFSHLMRVDFFSENKKEESTTLRFLNSDGYFYEETFQLNMEPQQKETLSKALRKNHVWVNSTT